jgi:hypothetical protein
MNRYSYAFLMMTGALALALVCPPVAAFDFDTGYAPIELVIPRVVPPIFGFLSPGGNDATLVLRATTMITNGWFDAIAPYHATSVGAYSQLGRRPVEEGVTNHNRNVAILYASYRVLNSLLPQFHEDWRDMLTEVGLDPDDDSEDLATAIGIGNAAGNAVVAVREHDGMNQLGDEGGVVYNRQPYADYLGYAPVNTPYALKDPSRWQPQIVTMGNGIFRVQQFVTPQFGVTLPYSYVTPNQFNAPVPTKSNPKGAHGRQQYKAQADEVLAASAAMTDEQKMMAELFDNKILSLGFSALHAAQMNNLTLEEFVHYDFLANVAAFDTGIAIWKEKRKHDAVRPFSAIRHLYGDDPVTAWGGPGQGTVSDLPASQWRSYLDTADHPEYPSGSAAFCSAHAQASRLYFGSDVLNWSVPAPQGSSRVEPGLTPQTDIVLHWDTWTDLETDCGLSRLWSGVHFYASIEAAHIIGRQIGELAYHYVQGLIAGDN